MGTSALTDSLKILEGSGERLEIKKLSDTMAEVTEKTILQLDGLIEVSSGF